MAPIKKSKKISALAIMLFLGLEFSSSSSLATPYLQLDIAGGTYDAATQTIVAAGDPFTLYAYLYDPTGSGLSEYYYISAALAQKTNDRNRGSFTISSHNFVEYNAIKADVVNTVNFASDIYVDYGNPPHYDYDYNRWTKYLPYDTGDLDPHGEFSTVFKELKFSFAPGGQVTEVDPYDTKDRAMASDDIPSGTGMYYAMFEVDTSGLLPGNAIHFDLYTVVGRERFDGSVDYDVQYFADFAHDAESLDPPAASTSVPDASIMFLLGPGLVGLGLLGRRKFVN